MTKIDLQTYKPIIAKKLAYMVDAECKRTGDDVEETFRKLMTSATYQAMLDVATGLYVEPPPMLCEMLANEQKGDWEAWLNL